MELTYGEAVFCEWEPSLWDLRRAAKTAMQNYAPMKRFIVTNEVEYYSNFVERMFFDPKVNMKNALELGEAIVGAENGAWRCAALWSLESKSGVLLHKQDNKLFYAYIPVLTKEAAESECATSAVLAQFAKIVQGMPVQLERQISVGQHSLSEILEILSGSM